MEDEAELRTFWKSNPIAYVFEPLTQQRGCGSAEAKDGDSTEERGTWDLISLISVYICITYIVYYSIYIVYKLYTILRIYGIENN